MLTRIGPQTDLEGLGSNAIILWLPAGWIVEQLRAPITIKIVFGVKMFTAWGCKVQSLRVSATQRHWQLHGTKPCGAGAGKPQRTPAKLRREG